MSTLLRGKAVFAFAEALTRRNLISGILKTGMVSVPWTSSGFKCLRESWRLTHLVMTLSAQGHRGLAAHGDDAWCREGR